jgi:hypothetical protein
MGEPIRASLELDLVNHGVAYYFRGEDGTPTRVPAQEVVTITDDSAGGDATYVWRPGSGHEPFPRYLPARMRAGLESGAWHFDPGTLFRLGNFDPVLAARETILANMGRMLAESPMTIGAPIGSIAEPAPPPAIPPCVCGGRDSERIMLGVDMATGGATSRAEARPFLVCRDCGTIRDMKVAIESAARRPTYRRYEPPGAIRLPTEVTPLDPAVAERMDRARAAMLAQHARDFAEMGRVATSPAFLVKPAGPSDDQESAAVKAAFSPLIAPVPLRFVTLGVGDYKEPEFVPGEVLRTWGGGSLLFLSPGARCVVTRRDGHAVYLKEIDRDAPEVRVDIDSARAYRSFSRVDPDDGVEKGAVGKEMLDVYSGAARAGNAIVKGMVSGQIGQAAGLAALGMSYSDEHDRIKVANWLDLSEDRVVTLAQTGLGIGNLVSSGPQGPQGPPGCGEQADGRFGPQCEPDLVRQTAFLPTAFDWRQDALAALGFVIGPDVWTPYGADHPAYPVELPPGWTKTEHARGTSCFDPAGRERVLLRCGIAGLDDLVTIYKDESPS